MSSRDNSYGTKSQRNVSTDRSLTQRQYTQPLKLRQRLHLALSTERTSIDRKLGKHKRKFIISNSKKLPPNFFGGLTPKDSTKKFKTGGNQKIIGDDQTPHFMDQKLDFTFRTNLTKHLSHLSEERMNQLSPAKNTLGIKLSHSMKISESSLHFRSLDASKPAQESPTKEENTQKFDRMLNSLLNVRNRQKPHMTFFKKLKPNLLPPIMFSFRKQLKP